MTADPPPRRRTGRSAATPPRRHTAKPGSADINAPPPAAAKRVRNAAAAAGTAANTAPPRPAKRRAGGPATPAADDSEFVPLSIAIEGDAVSAGRCVHIRAAADAAGAADGTGPPSTSSASSAALVVTGLPVTWRPASDVLRALMSVFGPVAGVAVDAAAGGTSAVVLFEQGGEGRDPVRAALAAARAGRVVAVAEADLPPLERPIGLKAWVEGHKGLFPGTEALQAEVDAWMAAFDAEEARKAAAASTVAAADDGWTVVVRGGGRKKTTGPGGVTVGAVAPAAAAARAAAAKPLKVDTDFYRFQKRDARRHELADLRAKFEEDKRRIADLRASRRFRPG